jgi:serine/threonine protein kinase
MIDNQSANAYSAYSADVWAAGVCLWILIYGTLPFWAAGPSHLPDPIFEQILSSKVAPPKFPSRRSPELCELLLDIFTVTPQDRPTFQALSKYSWIQQHSHDEIETRLDAISSVSIDCSEIHLDLQHAVTPGEVNFLSDRAKSHFVKMARRIRERVRERHQVLLDAKDEEIETKKEEMRHYDPIPSSPPIDSPPPAAPATSPPRERLTVDTSPPIAHAPVPPPAAAPSSSVSALETSSVSPTARANRPSDQAPRGNNMGREYSKQSNWTSQSDLEGAGESRALTNTGSGETKSPASSNSCCSIQ